MCFENMLTFAIVPVKRLSEAKSSLSAVLTPKQRRELVLAMLKDVLKAMSGARSITGTIVVSPDDYIIKFARKNGADGIAEPGVELNEALKIAIQSAITNGATSVLIMPSDIPFLTAADIENIVAMASSQREIVITPSKDNGTNALFLKPPDVMSPRFGGESFPAHLSEAHRAGVKPRIYRSITVATDIDDSDDLVETKELGHDTQTYKFLNLRSVFNQKVKPKD
jgi:2-phospho-L-lactate guanylyltransferase